MVSDISRTIWENKPQEILRHGEPIPVLQHLQQAGEVLHPSAARLVTTDTVQQQQLAQSHAQQEHHLRVAHSTVDTVQQLSQHNTACYLIVVGCCTIICSNVYKHINVNCIGIIAKRTNEIRI